MTTERIKKPDYADVKGEPPMSLLVTAMPFFISMTGALVKTLGRAAPGALKAMGAMNASLVTGIGLFGMKKTSGAIPVAGEWLKMITGIKADYEIGGVSETEVEVLLKACPLGLTAEHGRALCLTAMATDMKTVEKLGARLEIGETIATGADRCHLKVVSPKSD